MTFDKKILLSEFKSKNFAEKLVFTLTSTLATP